LGKSRKNLEDFKEKTGILALRWSPEKSQIELVGLKQQIEDTLMCLEGHSQYHVVYQEMNKEQDSLAESFAELGRGGKGYGKGRKGRADEKVEDKSRKGSAKGKGKSNNNNNINNNSADEAKPVKPAPAPDMGRDDFPDLQQNDEKGGKSNGKSKSRKGKA